ncbi:hypothetical protein [Rhizobium sp. SAFR-030]|uniref:hypothetical protein n=1 Tax=Rhizobium sp. SAFR-030 TaxID=3387277 RepID=UPI003F7FB718
MTKDGPADLSARMGDACGASKGQLWPDILSKVVIDLCAKQEVITNTEVVAELRKIAEDERADRLVRDGAGEALKRLMGKPAAVRSD